MLICEFLFTCVIHIFSCGAENSFPHFFNANSFSSLVSAKEVQKHSRKFQLIESLIAI